MTTKSDLSRREALTHLALGAGAVAATVTVACGSSRASPPSEPISDARQEAGTDTSVDTGTPDLGTSVATSLGPEDFTDRACVLAPAMTAGPYYFSVDQLRRDITEGKPGVPLRLGFRVMDENCQPIPDALVDIWHCDALGYYAGFAYADPDEGVPDRIVADEDETFLRGVQPTREDGIAEFVTIYPGFYRIRTVHVHVKVHLDDNELVTTQTFFDDSVSDEVYRSSPYNQREARDIYNTDEGVRRSDVMDIVALDDGYRATITLQVRRS